MPNPQADSGVWGAAKARAVTLLTIAQTRLELLGNEIEVARVTAMRELKLVLALLFCVAMGVVVTVIYLTLLFWEQRLLVVGLSCTLFWALALYCFLAMRSAAQKAEPPFSASLAELQEDLRQLKAATRHGPAAD